ncbi:MAG: threonylcarbamoyl-AMP synthase [Tissierellia bacterium]|nr:threonylcarbamoyl-AMP synthase [Tissierellia bacterium]
MNTEVIKLTEENFKKSIKKGAELIRKEEVVAFPTETVYGLGGAGFSPLAIRKIFEAKGRPQDNPLILHIGSMEMLDDIATDIRDYVYLLMEKFWPGPITFVLNKKSVVPMEVSAGLTTVGVRFPSERTAQALILEAGLPIAAPSANTSGKPSPTNAEAVFEDMKGRIPLILDGGQTDIGIESTVLLSTGEKPIILRPGKVSYEDIREVVASVEISAGLKQGEKPMSPGQKYRHYAPKADMYLFVGKFNDVASRILFEEARWELEDKKIGILCFDETRERYSSEHVISLGSYFNREEVSRNLFNSLRDFDKLGVDVILSESVEEKGIGRAIFERMRRAAKEVVNV